MRLAVFPKKKSSSNVSEVTCQLLKELQVPVTTGSVIKQVESHPDFPSMYSITDSLGAWKIDHAAMLVEPGVLEELPTPFIAHVRRGGGNFILIRKIREKIEIINEKG